MTYNEARHLRRCLESVRWCDEILVVDLGSEDECVEIAREYGATIYHHERVEIVEDVVPFAFERAKHDWILRIDPDEVWDNHLEKGVRDAINDRPELAKINIPWQFYFKGHKLSCSFWGGIKYKSFILHKDRVILQRFVHGGVRSKEEITYTLVGYDEFPVKHYWMDSYGQLVRKHWRYIRREGEARFHNGERFSWYGCCRASYHALRQGAESWFKVKNMAPHNLFLIFFWCWYVFMAQMSLRKYQKGLSKGGDS